MTTDIRVGARVHVTHIPEKDREYGWEGGVARRKNNGHPGMVEKSSDAHGLCFLVRHDNGDAAWWEPEELTVIPEHPAVTLLRALQWAGGDEIAVCPACGAPKHPWSGKRQHEADCALAAIIEGKAL